MKLSGKKEKQGTYHCVWSNFILWCDFSLRSKPHHKIKLLKPISVMVY